MTSTPSSLWYFASKSLFELSKDLASTPSSLWYFARNSLFELQSQWHAEIVLFAGQIKLGTQSMMVTSMHQATIFQGAILCLDWQISCQQTFLCSTVRPHCHLHYQNELAYSLCCLRLRPKCHICLEGSHDQGQQAQEMACWHRYLSLSQVAEILLPSRTQVREPCRSIHVEFYKASRKSFCINEDLLNLELQRMPNYSLSSWVMQLMAMA